MRGDEHLKVKSEIKLAGFSEIIQVFRIKNDTHETIPIIGGESFLLTLYIRANVIATKIMGKLSPFPIVVLVKMVGKEVVGFVSVKFRREKRLGEITLFVKKEHRNRGHGSGLLGASVAFISKKGYTPMLSVKESNKIAHNLYKKAGFKETCKIVEMVHDG